MDFPAWVKPPTPCNQHTNSHAGTITPYDRYGIVIRHTVRVGPPRPLYVASVDFAARVMPTHYTDDLDAPCGPGCVNW